MALDPIDFTPDPRVLVALTNTPLRPIDALCELIDNAVDSYRAAALSGQPSDRPTIEITVPGAAAVRQGQDAIAIKDFGTGLSAASLGNVLRAGYSGQNRYDSLGLFGLGFNIAVGKIGRRTVIETAEVGASKGVSVVYDLMNIVASGGFKSQPTEYDHGGGHGTTVTISDWWPAGHANANFALKLADIPKARLRNILGRRYATLLRGDEGKPLKMFVNGVEVEPFEHCVWNASRTVLHDRQPVQARFDFDEKVGQTTRCVKDGISVGLDTSECPACGSADLRVIEEHVRGWIGIQTYDSTIDYGIDVIRNGRAILVDNRDAFFTYIDDEGQSHLEYPIDDAYGRVVGEVHLDHVPVHFTKEDFERTTEEWDRALDYIRGKALRSGRWGAGYSNASPVSRLVRAYGRVRKFGKGHLYPGKWDLGKQKPLRISRAVEEDLLAKFRAREPGYLDDAKWYEYVEAAETPVVPHDAFLCPNCPWVAQETPEVCDGCAYIVRGKACRACEVRIPESAITCQECGEEQLLPVDDDWGCAVCLTVNESTSDTCKECNSVRGARNPLDLETLRASSEIDESLSRVGLQVRLSDGTITAPIDVETFRAGPLPAKWQGERLPLVVDKGTSIRLYIDFRHPVFSGTGLNPLEAVSIEAASYFYQYHQQLMGTPGHTVAALTTQVVLAMKDEDSSGADIEDRIRDLLSESARLLEGIQSAPDYFGELGEAALQRCLVRMGSAVQSSDVDSLRTTGRYLAFLDPRDLVAYFEFDPAAWFERVWNTPIAVPAGVSEETARVVGEHKRSGIARCLHECAAFLSFPTEEAHARARTVAAFDYLDSLRS